MLFENLSCSIKVLSTCQGGLSLFIEHSLLRKVGVLLNHAAGIDTDAFQLRQMSTTLCDVSQIGYLTLHITSSWKTICMRSIKDGMRSTALFQGSKTLFRSSSPPQFGGLGAWSPLTVSSRPYFVEIDDNCNASNTPTGALALMAWNFKNSSDLHFSNMFWREVEKRTILLKRLHSATSVHRHWIYETRWINIFRYLSKW